MVRGARPCVTCAAAIALASCTPPAVEEDEEEPPPPPADAAPRAIAAPDAARAPETPPAALAGPDAGRPPAADAGAAASPGDEDAWLRQPVPILWLTVNGQRIAKDVDTPGTMKLVEGRNETSPLTSLEGRTVLFESPMGIQARGMSSSYLYAQKPYGIEVQDAAGKDRDVALLGMPKDSDWVLSSCYSDKTCLRNALTYAVGREMGQAAGRWAPQARWVEVYLDGKYNGLYVLTERPKGDKDRMNLTKPAPSKEAGDITGAYVFVADGDAQTFSYKPRDDRREWYDMRANRRWKHKFPRWRDVTSAQKQYISSTFDALEVALLGRTDWRKRIDAPSWVDYYLISELTNNVDSFYRSWYFYKLPDSQGGRFHMGPVWDFDLAYGNVNYGKWYCASTSIIATPPAPFAVPVQDPTFQNEMKCRWYELRQPGGPLDVRRLEARIDAFAAHVKQAKARDAQRWGNVGKYVWPNNYVGATWEDEVRYLKFWIRRRLAWVDQRLKGQCPGRPAPAPVEQVRPPPNAPNDMRLAQAMAKPPQIDPATAPHTYVPLDGPADPKWACPPP